jgi:hypothetical protein
MVAEETKEMRKLRTLNPTPDSGITTAEVPTEGDFSTFLVCIDGPHRNPPSTHFAEIAFVLARTTAHFQPFRRSPTQSIVRLPPKPLLTFCKALSRLQTKNWMKHQPCSFISLEFPTR